MRILLVGFWNGWMASSGKTREPEAINNGNTVVLSLKKRS